MSLEKLKVGDEVVRTYGSLSMRYVQLAKIERLTPKQAVIRINSCATVSYWLKDGTCVGGNGSIRIPSEKDRKDLTARNNRDRFISVFKHERFTDEQLTQLLNAYDAMGIKS